MRLAVLEVLAFLVVFFGLGQIVSAASSGAVHITVRIRPPDSALLAPKTDVSKPVVMLAGAALFYQVSLANFSSTANVKLPLSLESRPWTVRYA